ncbi:type II toxin-antitoxin system RelE/ParE family toxin [Pelosinus fermentans]|uniref:Addiction module toxin, RelE/StbE family n=1 Tax=Pelosinus fermentans JBW45 TaxID=1192197 RepID=I8U293_9FIRM|nr:type II toxin-antitoxin system RelE/ParE family toxin [Pelosinus fermentans]AJQ29900.1 addiction module toxin, RelE/StbE family [Pelosinus fermentans JBW45]
MGKYRVEYLPLAYDDLDEIFTYIAADDSRAAANLLNEIDTAVLHLEDFPDMGVNLKNRRLANKGYKMLVVNDYLVFYVVIGSIVEIRRIVSSKRNYTKLF